MGEIAPDHGRSASFVHTVGAGVNRVDAAP